MSTSPRVASASLGSATMSALVWSAAGQWGSQVFALVTYLVLARLLGPTEFGLVALAGVYIAFVQIFVNQGLAAVIVQRESIEDRHLDSAFWTSVAVGVALAVLSAAGAGRVATLMGEPQLGPLIVWLSAALVVTSLSSVQLGLLKRALRFKALARRTLVASAVGNIVAVAMAFGGYGVWSLVAQQLVTAAVRLGLLWGQSSWRPRPRFSWPALRELLPFSLSMLGNNLVDFANRQSDKLLIGVVLGPTALGFYVVGFRVYRSITKLMTGFVGQVAFSSFSAMQDDIPRLRASFYRVTGLSAAVGFPAFALIGGCAALLIPMALGEQWLDSVPILQVLAVAGAIECLLFFNPSVMFALGRAHWKLYVGLLNTLLNLAFIALALPFGITAVAFAYTLRLLVLAPLPVHLVRRLIEIDYASYLARVRMPVLGGLLLGAYSWAMASGASVATWDRLLTLGIVLACGLGAYALLLRAWDETLMRSIASAVRALRRR